jgi:hypothetical protein
MGRAGELCGVGGRQKKQIPRIGQSVLGFWGGLQKVASSRRAPEKRPPRKSAATKSKEHPAKIGHTTRLGYNLQQNSAVEGQGGVALAEYAYSLELTDRSRWFE